MNVSITYLVWLLAACIFGFGLSAIFSNWLKLSRNIFLIPYIALTTIFIISFFWLNNFSFSELIIYHWPWGVLAGAIVGAIVAKHISSQPFSRTAQKGKLLFEIIWLGICYGVIDALFLNVIPVLMARYALSFLFLPETLLSQIIFTVLSIILSLTVTFFYHLGYPEFRNKKMRLVLTGNVFIILAFVVSSNPLGAIVGHTIMHIAAVMRGPEKTLQLPPHFN